MSKRQLFALFCASLFPWTLGSGLLPLLPVYARELGANSTVAGLYLALVYVGLVAGALGAGVVSNRLGRRKLPHILAGAIAVPVVWGMGRVRSILGLTLLTAALWLLGGLSIALINILAGLCAEAQERGRVFGILGMAGGVAAILGGLSTGPAVDR